VPIELTPQTSRKFPARVDISGRNNRRIFPKRQRFGGGLLKMDERHRRIASIANDLSYGDEAQTRRYINGAPHIKHASLRALYSELVVQVYDAVSRHTPAPRVLDLGAGEGSVTLPFLELGAHVLAVDLSEHQLDVLRQKCDKFKDRIEVRKQDIHETLQDKSRKFDIIAGNSFLHHIPDYLTLIRQATPLLAPHGVFFSFQDPLRYDSVGLPTRMLTDTAYFFWRLSLGSKGDVLAGVRRRMRRRSGVYLENCYQDNAEYHVVRNGVDQNAIAELFKSLEYGCRVVTYFSSQNSVFQPVGTVLGMKNTFSVIAQRAEVGTGPTSA
jgi:SAM-dependent methyltransferase